MRGRGGGGGRKSPSNIFMLKNTFFFLFTELKMGQKNRNVLSDYLGYVTTEKNEKPASYGKHKRSIPVTRLQRKRGTVHSYTHTHTHTHTWPMLLDKLCQWAQIFYSAPYSNKPSAYIPHSMCKTKFHAHKTNRQNRSHSQKSFYTAFYRIFTTNTPVVEDWLKT